MKMIFRALEENDAQGELILVNGGFCRFHVRKDTGQLTIYEIYVLEAMRGQGIGTTILHMLCDVPGATSIFAKCSVELRANDWYKAMGFTHEGVHTDSSDHEHNMWRLS